MPGKKYSTPRILREIGNPILNIGFFILLTECIRLIINGETYINSLSAQYLEIMPFILYT